MKNWLFGIIVQDMYRRGKLAILLLILVFISAFSVLWVTYQTRLKVNQKEQLLVEQEALQMEWNNLILEENVFADPARIEKIAKEKLSMHNVTPDKEILVIKSK